MYIDIPPQKSAAGCACDTFLGLYLIRQTLISLDLVCVRLGYLMGKNIGIAK